MYIEVFLLDNLLLNLLIVRLAAALLTVRPPLYRQLSIGLVSALIAAAAAYLWPTLKSPLLRAPLLFLISLALPVKGIRGLACAVTAAFLSTLIVGGCAFAIVIMTGESAQNGSLSGGITLRTALIGALAASFLPRAARKVLRRRLKNEAVAEIVILRRGVLRRFTAIVDTGNTLTEPVTGLPVAVIRCRAFEAHADLPVSAVTAAGRITLSGFIPEKVSVNGREVACIVALTRERLSADALIPPELCL